MGRKPKEIVQQFAKSAWDRMSPLHPRRDRPLKQFYSNPSSPNTTPRSSTEGASSSSSRSSTSTGIAAEGDIITVTIPVARAIERMLVPKGTRADGKDMVLQWYLSAGRDAKEVVEEWRKVGDVVVSRREGREEKYKFDG